MENMFKSAFNIDDEEEKKKREEEMELDDPVIDDDQKKVLRSKFKKTDLKKLNMKMCESCVQLDKTPFTAAICTKCLT